MKISDEGIEFSDKEIDEMCANAEKAVSHELRSQFVYGHLWGGDSVTITYKLKFLPVSPKIDAKA